MAKNTDKDHPQNGPEDKKRIAILARLQETASAFFEDYKRNSGEENTREDKRYKLERGGLVLLVCTTLFTGAIFAANVFQLSTARQTMIGDQRAWIAPDKIVIDRSQPDPLGQGHDALNLIVFFHNAGKSPALDLSENLEFGSTDIVTFSPTIIDRGPQRIERPFPQLSISDACKDFVPTDGGKAIFPGSPDDAQQTPWHKQLPFTVPFMEGKWALIAHGCFAYRSFGSRQTAYCYYFEPVKDQPFRNWNVRLCPNGGNYAN